VESKYGTKHRIAGTTCNFLALFRQKASMLIPHRAIVIIIIIICLWGKIDVAENENVF
jgi:hypothetical protein